MILELSDLLAIAGIVLVPVGTVLVICWDHEKRIVHLEDANVRT